MMNSPISKLFIFILISLNLTNCKNETSPAKDEEKNTEVKDELTFADLDKAKITHLTWQITADFDQKILKGSATYQIENQQSSELILDTDHLQIDSVKLENSEKTSFQLGQNEPVRGTPLKIKIKPDTKIVTIYYQTSPESAALQWLSPSQTHDKKYPFLLTQGQAILTRSYIPIQDTPSIRITYDATVKVPKELMAVMSAENPKMKNDTGIYHFKMPQTIPPYLIALAIGDLKYQSIDQRSGVYAEPGMIDKAAWEFADTGKMIDTAEKMYGKYPWEQYDILVLPPSFPFGGMENPRLTFATPTVIAGDRSMVSLVAHELAHSWSGNLVTNQTWDDFWLNEGFTTYLERRIMEEINGKDYSDMIAVIGYQDWQTALTYLDPKLTSLWIDLGTENPDDASSDVPYEKGYSFLKMLENKYGREKFDAFLNSYFKTFSFQTMNTKKFIDFMKTNLTEGEDDFVQNWIYDQGVPKGYIPPQSERFQKAEDKLNQDLTFIQNKEESKIQPNTSWSTLEWVHYLRKLKEKNLTSSQLSELDQIYHLTQSKNAEIEAAWFECCILAKYDKAYPALEVFLVEVGRRKYLEPLYRALVKSGQREIGLEIYQKARPGYHFVSYTTVDEILDVHP